MPSKGWCRESASVPSSTSRLGLGGFVCNRAGGVLIEVEGESEALERFVDEVRRRPPPLARIEGITWSEGEARGESRFRIDESQPARRSSRRTSPPATTACTSCSIPPTGASATPS